MRNPLIAYDLNCFSVRQNRVTLWFYRLELFIYFIFFVLVIYVIYSQIESKIGVRLGIIGALVIPFIIISINKIDSIVGKDFYMSRENKEVIINRKLRIDTIGIDAVSVTEMVSTYSAHGYYDIRIREKRKNHSIALGIDEDSRDKILKGLDYFFSADSA